MRFTMLPLGTFIDYNGRIFDLLDSSAANACDAARAADELASAHGHATSATSLGEIRHRGKELTLAINQELINCFAAVLDREDVEAISAALYEIPKTIEKFAIRYIDVATRLEGIDLAQRTGILLRCAELDEKMVNDLRSRRKIATMSDLNDQLRTLEIQADELFLEPYGNLCLRASDAILALLVRDLFEMLEQAIDRCRDLGRIVYSITLKNA